MFTFQQFCEFITCNQRYSWFYISRALINELSGADKSLVVLEDKPGEELIRAWYPVDKYNAEQVRITSFKSSSSEKVFYEKYQKYYSKGIAGLGERMRDAIDKNDTEEINKITEIFKVMQEAMKGK